MPLVKQTWRISLKLNIPRFAVQFATFDNYRLPRKNASYHLVNWHGHLWGGRFQMAALGERQVAGGNGRRISAQKAG